MEMIYFIIGMAVLVFMTLLELKILEEVKMHRLMIGRQIVKEIWKEVQPQLDEAESEEERRSIKAITYDRIMVDVWENTEYTNIYREEEQNNE